MIPAQNPPQYGDELSAASADEEGEAVGGRGGVPHKNWSLIRPAWASVYTVSVDDDSRCLGSIRFGLSWGPLGTKRRGRVSPHRPPAPTNRVHHLMGGSGPYSSVEPVWISPSLDPRQRRSKIDLGT